MATHNHTGAIWSNVPIPAHRRRGPGTKYEIIDSLQPNQSLVVLCYAHGDQETFTTPTGQVETSTAWDFVVTSDQDPGGYVSDVFIDTGGDITRQLGPQGSREALLQRL